MIMTGIIQKNYRILQLQAQDPNLLAGIQDNGDGTTSVINPYQQLGSTSSSLVPDLMVDASYDSVGQNLNVTFNLGNGGVNGKVFIFPASTTVQVANPAASSTYYAYLDASGNLNASTSQPEGSLLLATIALDASYNVTVTDQRCFVSTSPAFPAELSWTYTTVALTASASTNIDLTSFMNRGLVRQVKLNLSAAGTAGVDVTLYSDSARTIQEYQKLGVVAISTTPVVDNALWFHKDASTSDKVYATFNNHDAVTYQVTIAVLAEQFA